MASVLFRNNLPYKYVDVDDVFIHFTTYHKLEEIVKSGEIKSPKMNVQFAYNISLSKNFPCWACLPTDRLEVAIIFVDNLEDWEFYGDECMKYGTVNLRDFIVVSAKDALKELIK